MITTVNSTTYMGWFKKCYFGIYLINPIITVLLMTVSVFSCAFINEPYLFWQLQSWEPKMPWRLPDLVCWKTYFFGPQVVAAKPTCPWSMKSQLKWKDSKLYTSVASHELHSANFQLVDTYKRNGKSVIILINYKGIKVHINYTNDEFASNWTKQMFMLETFFSCKS